MPSQYEEIKNIIENKLVNRTELRTYEQLSETLFGAGNKFSDSEVRKRMYGMKRMIDIIECDRCNNTKILSISDLHIPFLLDFKCLKKYVNNIDILQINGDICDHYGLSSFSKVYRCDPVDEIILARQYLIDLIKFINPKKVIITYGNHDNRFQSFIAKTMNTDLLDLHPLTAIELIVDDGFYKYDRQNGAKTHYEPIAKMFDGAEIVYTKSWFCLIGDCIFCHPKAYSSAIMKTAEKAMQWFRNEGFQFRRLVMAHTHRIGQYVVGNTTIYEQGCFCDVTKNDYSDGKFVNSQKEGFIYLEQDEYGNTVDDSVRLVVLN